MIAERKKAFIAAVGIVAVLFFNPITLASEGGEQRPEPTVVEKSTTLEIKNTGKSTRDTIVSIDRVDISEHQSFVDVSEVVISEPTTVINAKSVDVKPKPKVVTSQVKQNNTTTVTSNGGYLTVNLSESEVYMLAQLIYLEAGNCSRECQLAVGSVTINLMKAGGCSLSSLAHNKNVFSVAPRVDYTTPSETSLSVARQLATSGTTVPPSVKCFRNNHYFSWATPYMTIDNVYFSSY